MTNFITLEHLLAAKRPATQPLVSGDDGGLNWGQWLQKVAAWRLQLAPLKNLRWALYHQDAGEFSAILLALWSLGKVVYLPASRQPELLRELALQVDGFVGDFEALPPALTVDVLSAPASCITILGGSLDASLEEQLRDQLQLMATITLDSQAPLLQVYTSGSSGAPQCIAKSIGQLSLEVSVLHELWGRSRQDVQVAATVSHQHLYGLLFRVLWPLSAGWSFDARACEYLEQLSLRAPSDKTLFLVSSPSHLSRLPKEIDQCGFVSQLAAVFSSGAPLQRVDALAVRQQLAVPVTEVYGSTETGGVAWREQDTEQAARWQPLPTVSIRQQASDQCLAVSSNFLAAGEGWFQSADKVRIDAQGQFELLGRLDRIVKVEGKRVSLDQMEMQLATSTDVDSVRLLQLVGKRSELAAVVVLTKPADASLQLLGKRALKLRLKEYLLQYFERPTLPRKWRFVSALPIDSQGKISHQNLLSLFERDLKKTQFPSQLGCEQLSPEQLSLSLQVPTDLLFFEGHFEHTPILPGVVQIHWAEHYARKTFAPLGDFVRMEVVKFQKILTPGDFLQLELKYNRDKNKVSFLFSSAAGKHASGRLVFGGSP